MISSSPWVYFYDPVLRAPTIGSMLMCLAAALVGVLVFLRKQSLVGESLSHAAYPGVIMGVIIAGLFGIEEQAELTVALLIMGGAFVTSLLGLLTISFLETRLKVHSDSALCFVLASFFGIGLTLASEVQVRYTPLYSQVISYLYGQAATMTDVHILIYGLLSLFITLLILFFYKELQAISFDRHYAKALGIPVRRLDLILFLMIVLAVVIGIRSVGVILMSAMLIAPAAAARQYTDKLYIMLFLAAIFGVLSGFLGNFLSLELTTQWSESLAYRPISLPTGPMIVLVASALCFLSLLMAPGRGLLWRLIRIARFRRQCLQENILKSMWRLGAGNTLSFDQIKRYQNVSFLYLQGMLLALAFNGWIDRLGDSHFKLTKEGEIWAARIVRLHRLWEVYLADYLGVGAERVHRSAEEMEHILTPELEKELTLLLKDPKEDPHHQPIPPKIV
jgi:manganese/zinc/iron transport system permease protein